jgi:hypothetical protein
MLRKLIKISISNILLFALFLARFEQLSKVGTVAPPPLYPLLHEEGTWGGVLYSF